MARLLLGSITATGRRYQTVALTGAILTLAILGHGRIRANSPAGAGVLHSVAAPSATPGNLHHAVRVTVASLNALHLSRCRCSESPRQHRWNPPP